MPLLISFHSESESHRFARMVSKPFRSDGHVAEGLALVHDVRGELALEGASADLESAVRLLYVYFNDSFSDYLFIDEDVPRTYSNTRAGSLVDPGYGIVRRSGLGLSWCLVDSEGRIALLNTHGGADIPYRASRDRYALDRLTSVIWELEGRTERQSYRYSSPDGEGFVYTRDSAPRVPLRIDEMPVSDALIPFLKGLQLDSETFPSLTEIDTRKLRWRIPTRTLFTATPP